MASKTGSRKRARSAGPTYQLKITLRGSKPPIWRRILVPGNCDLELVHAAIQAAMGWSDDHLHAFIIEGQEYSGRTPFGDKIDSDGLDAAGYRLADVVPQEKSKFSYEYDFGDGWEHVILVEKILPPPEPGGAPAASQSFFCLAGEGACPLEDCGGIWGYYHLLEVLQNPKHSEHEEMKEWAGGIIDPDAFDLGAANKRLSHLRHAG